MDERERLRNVVERRKKKKSEPVAMLGDMVKSIVDKRITPQQKNVGSVIAVWNKLVPAEVKECCKLIGISAGQLKVEVNSPSYMYELQLCSEELVKELGRSCPRAGIKKIKFVAG